jgi:LmbE family N-acetylglucosaminyl deacetylase
MRVLAVGAHPDDIELGCGGALLAHRARGDEITLLVMTTGEEGPQDARSRIREQEDAAALLGATLLWGGFPDGAVPNDRSAVNVVQHAMDVCGADIVYGHTAGDTHQDHRHTSAAVLAAARRARRVLLFESPTSVRFAPSVYLDIAGYVEAKIDLLRAHMSQVLKNGLVDLEALEAQARYHGFRARVRYAEAFETERFLLDLVAGPAPAAADRHQAAELVSRVG